MVSALPMTQRILFSFPLCRHVNQLSYNSDQLLLEPTVKEQTSLHLFKIYGHILLFMTIVVQARCTSLSCVVAIDITPPHVQM